ncbi:MAG TPA: DNA/RNA non-specific endonuclease [Gemmatimonadaceae bacterium]
MAGPVVISQVYGGGGNSGATLTNDFIEIHNNGSIDVSVEGWSVQYASAAGSFSGLTPIHGTIAAGQYLLVQEAKGAGGTVELPVADDTGTVAMSATAGKVALVKNTTLLSCGTTAAPCTSAVIADLVGFGGASAFEGSGPTAVLSNTNAALRKGAGCTDTDNNNADFSVGPPAPRNTKSSPVTCGEAAPRVTGTTPTAGGILGAPETISISFSELVNVDAGWYRISCSATGDHSATVTGGPQTFTLSSLGDFAPAESCTGTVFGASVTDQDSDDPPDTMSADFTWTFTTEALAQPLPETRFSEIHYDNSGDDVGEQIEIEGPANTDLGGWSIVLYNGGSGQSYDTRALSGFIPATCGERGVVVVPFATIQNGSPDGFALVHNAQVVQFLSYEGSFAAVDGPATGITSTDIKVEEPSSSSAISSLQLNSTTSKWFGPSRRTFGRCNKDGPPPFDITFSGRVPINDPPLPVGFEDQLFATMVDLAGTTVSTSFSWSSDTPALASIDQNGVMHSLAAGQAVFRATSTNGTSATYSLPTAVATLGGTAEYVGNAEFGIPSDGSPSDDFIIARDQYTISYNPNRNTPNWVSYEFDASHFQAPGGDNIDRCDCFTHDPALPASFTHLTTADYTGAGAFAGYGIDRGHMARSFDFTSGTLDNARSYYLSNIIPQAAAVNQGPWKILEDTLGNLARFDDKEVYIVDGVAGTKGTVKNEGKIVMPAYVWKVALILPRNHRLADVHDYTDIDDVIAVIMPNDPVVNSDWKTYKTTVDEIERTSGYDLLSLLPDKVESAVESNTIIAAKALNGASTVVQALSTTAGLTAGEANSLLAKIDAAQKQLGIGNAIPAANQLRSMLKELDAMVGSGRVSESDAAALRALVEGVLDSLA